MFYVAKLSDKQIEELDLENLTNGRISFVILLEYCFEQNYKILKNLEYPDFYDNNYHLHLGNNAINQLNVIPDPSNKKKSSKIFH